MLIDRYITFCFTAAEPETALTRLASEGVVLAEIIWVDSLTLKIRVKNNQFGNVQCILEKMGIETRVVQRQGALWIFRKICSRPVFLAGMCLFCVLGILLPGRILLIKVEGCEKISEKFIIQQAENCGVRFGYKTSKLRSEDVKNELLEKISELQWVGVTISGCEVTIHIRERSINEEDTIHFLGVSSVIASQDGVITEMTVYQGNPLLQVGDFVCAGDVIISGYTDSGFKLIAEQALGEVFAYTQRKCSVITPAAVTKRSGEITEHTCYRLHIGKKVIKFCKHSGIPDSTCVKMYTEYYWSLMDGTQFPVYITKTKIIYFDTISVNEKDEIIEWLLEYARDYLCTQMISGRILDESVLWYADNDLYELKGSYACHEMIGQEKREEIVEEDAKDN